MPFNGPGRELQTSLGLHEEVVYCTMCGSIFVRNHPRSCPACTLAEQLEEIEERLDRAERDIDIIDGGI